MALTGHTESGHSHLRLKVYPTVILQLSTISLLMSLSSSAMAVMPAATGTTTADAPMKVAILPKEIVSEDYQPITDPDNVERFLKDYFADIPLMTKIAKCESHNRHYDSTGAVLKGEKTPLDRGVMQINLYYHGETAKKLGIDLNTIDGNVAYARYLYEKSGAQPWMSSSPCWSKFASPEVAKR